MDGMRNEVGNDLHQLLLAVFDDWTGGLASTNLGRSC